MKQVPVNSPWLFARPSWFSLAELSFVPSTYC
jgi:hypothetical protein